MKKLLNKFLLVGMVATPAFAFAASPFLKPIKDVLGDLEIFINFLNWALPAIGLLVFFCLVVYYILSKMGIVSGPSDGKYLGRGGALMWAIVALACMFAVYGLIQLVGALVGIDTNRSKTITAPSLPQVGGVRGGGYYVQ